MDPENIDALCDRAELYISQHMYEQAVEDYQTAHRIEDHPKKVPPCMLSSAACAYSKSMVEYI